MSMETEQVKPVGGGMSMPMENARKVRSQDRQGNPVLLVYPQLSPQARTDQDLGSGGLAYIADLNIVCGGGKDGLLYCMHADKMEAGPSSAAGFPQRARQLCEARRRHADLGHLMDPGPNTSRRMPAGSEEPQLPAVW